MMRISKNRELARLALVSSALISGCADDHAGSNSAPSDSETTDTGDSAFTDTMGSDATSGTAAIDLDPWYGTWYALSPQTSVNALTPWGSGGNSFGFKAFTLRAGSATLQIEDCLWGPSRFEYAIVDENGVAALEPVSGLHEYEPHGEIERLYVQPGVDCGSMIVREVGTDGEERELFSSSGAPLTRGKLCLEYCAEAEGEYGLISDCGVPVPWKCDE